MLFPNWQSRYVTILKTVKLPALLFPPSKALMPAENPTSEKANQNNSEVALYTHTGRRQHEDAVLYFPQHSYRLISTKPGTWADAKNVRGIFIVLCSAFPKFVGRDLALPWHLSPSSGAPKDFTEPCTVISRAGTCGMGQNHTFNGAQCTKRRQKEKGL